MSFAELEERYAHQRIYTNNRQNIELHHIAEVDVPAYFEVIAKGEHDAIHLINQEKRAGQVDDVTFGKKEKRDQYTVVSIVKMVEEFSSV